MKMENKNSDKSDVESLAKASRKVHFPFTEAQLLQRLDADTGHADELVDVMRVEWTECSLR